MFLLPHSIVRSRGSNRCLHPADVRNYFYNLTFSGRIQTTIGFAQIIWLPRNNFWTLCSVANVSISISASFLLLFDSIFCNWLFFCVSRVFLSVLLFLCVCVCVVFKNRVYFWIGYWSDKLMEKAAGTFSRMSGCQSYVSKLILYWYSDSQ